MDKKYLVTGNWVDKTTKKPVSRIAEITSGVGKDSGAAYEMANPESRETVEGTYAVGTILAATVNLEVQNSSGKTLNLQKNASA